MKSLFKSMLIASTVALTLPILSLSAGNNQCHNSSSSSSSSSRSHSSSSSSSSSSSNSTDKSCDKEFGYFVALKDPQVYTIGTPINWDRHAGSHSEHIFVSKPCNKIILETAGLYKVQYSVTAFLSCQPNPADSGFRFGILLDDNKFIPGSVYGITSSPDACLDQPPADELFGQVIFRICTKSTIQLVNNGSNNIELSLVGGEEGNSCSTPASILIERLCD